MTARAAAEAQRWRWWRRQRWRPEQGAAAFAPSLALRVSPSPLRCFRAPVATRLRAHGRQPRPTFVSTARRDADKPGGPDKQTQTQTRPGTQKRLAEGHLFVFGRLVRTGQKSCATALSEAAGLHCTVGDAWRVPLAASRLAVVGPWQENSLSMMRLVREGDVGRSTIARACAWRSYTYSLRARASGSP